MTPPTTADDWAAPPPATGAPCPHHLHSDFRAGRDGLYYCRTCGYVAAGESEQAMLLRGGVSVVPPPATGEGREGERVDQPPPIEGELLRWELAGDPTVWNVIRRDGTWRLYFGWDGPGRDWTYTELPADMARIHLAAALVAEREAKAEARVLLRDTQRSITDHGGWIAQHDADQRQLAAAEAALATAREITAELLAAERELYHTLLEAPGDTAAIVSCERRLEAAEKRAEEMGGEGG